MSESVPSPVDAPNVTYLWGQLLVEELVRHGVETFLVAPGSRSTPLTACAARHPIANVVLHVDERGTAFAALGAGRATGTPAAWITTSGTAVANGLPAVVEAATDGVPMILLTGDRPPELRDTGANQTIDQVKLFGEYVRWEADVPPPSDEVDPAYVLTTVDQAMHRAVRAPAGPVHLNFGFRKPLEPVDADHSVSVPTAVEEWAEGATPFTQYPTPRPTPSDDEIDRLAKALDGVEEGLVVAGRLDRGSELAATRRLANRLAWPLWPDVTSHLRLGSGEDGALIPFGDVVLCSDAFRSAHLPEAVLHVGGRYTSKRLRAFLRSARPEVWAVVRPNPSRIDPDHRTTHHVDADVTGFVDRLLDRLEPRNGGTEWRDQWADAKNRAERVIGLYVSGADRLSEPLVASLLSRYVPSSHAIVAASSMPVRALDRYADPAGAPVSVYANRGASGIDGTVSTAAGVAHGREGPVTLLIGDLALWHDLNGLALLDNSPVVVVVVNNDGGGIFHFLPIREHEDLFEPYFTTPHGRSFEDAAATFDLPYHRPETPSAFVEAYRAACHSGTSALIEVQTDREANREVHGALEEEVALALE